MFLYDRPTGELTLSINNQEQTVYLPAGAPLVGDGKTFLIGSAGADGSGYNASPNMTLRRLRFYDQATETEAPEMNVHHWFIPAVFWVLF